MTMTRKDFNNLAKDLRWFRLATTEWHHDPDFQDAFDLLIVDISNTCQTANPNFDHDRFRDAIYKEVTHV